ncbi:hypothetical protein BDZ91DRAFT_827015 [Kalaharituber pfeilii]|nr:hypothetical protein BDZ91DRAFT_827015 [Kalaharituber pfeilii]
MFRDVSMGGIVLGRWEGNQNALVDADGTKMEGSADFVIETMVPALVLTGIWEASGDIQYNYKPGEIQQPNFTEWWIRYWVLYKFLDRMRASKRNRHFKLNRRTGRVRPVRSLSSFRSLPRKRPQIHWFCPKCRSLPQGTTLVKTLITTKPRKKLKPAADPSTEGGEEEKKTEDTPNPIRVHWLMLREQEIALRLRQAEED